MRRIIADVVPSAVIYCAVPKQGGAARQGGYDVMTGICDDVVAAAEAAMMISARFIAISTDQVRHRQGKHTLKRKYPTKTASIIVSAYLEIRLHPHLPPGL